MKPVLYAGAALMIGASIYGFVDYKNNSRKSAFTGMYEEKKKTSPVVEADAEKKGDAGQKISAVKEKKNAVKKQPLIKKETAKTLKAVTGDDRTAITTNREIGKTEISIPEPAEENPEKKVVKKKKKISSKLFSRAPIREPEELSIKETPKAEEKKTGKKEL